MVVAELLVYHADTLAWKVLPGKWFGGLVYLTMHILVLRCHYTLLILCTDLFGKIRSLLKCDAVS
jgi:hypothetical protein